MSFTGPTCIDAAALEPPIEYSPTDRLLYDLGTTLSPLAFQGPATEALRHLTQDAREQKISRVIDSYKDGSFAVWTAAYNYFESLKAKKIFTEDQLQLILRLKGWGGYMKQQKDLRAQRMKLYETLLLKWTLEEIHPLISRGRIPANTDVKTVKKAIKFGYDLTIALMNRYCQLARNLTYTAAKYVFAMYMANLRMRGGPVTSSLTYTVSLAKKIIDQARTAENDPSRKKLYFFVTPSKEEPIKDSVQAMSNAIIECKERYVARYNNRISLDTDPSWFFDFGYLKTEFPDRPLSPNILIPSSVPPPLPDVPASSSSKRSRTASSGSGNASDIVSDFNSRSTLGSSDSAEDSLRASTRSPDGTVTKSNNTQRNKTALHGRHEVALSGSVSLVAGKDPNTQTTVLYIDHDTKKIELSLEDLPTIEDWVKVCKMRFCTVTSNITSISTPNPVIRASIIRASARKR